MAPLIDHLTQRKLARPRTLVLLGVDLKNEQEEAFVRMVCDGLSLGAAYIKAGFTAKGHDLPMRLFHKPHIQERARAILEARQSQGVVTLPEVTDMLKRVFAGALHDAEYSAAHNAAFSLARLYGHVTDKSTLEIIRRPSRDPDAPSEQALGAWVEALPGLAGPGLGALGEPQGASFLGPQGPREASFVRLRDAPSEPLGLDPVIPNVINGLDAEARGPEGPGPELSSDIKGLTSGIGVGGRPENGAPSPPVTGTPYTRAHSAVLGPEPQEPPPQPPVKEKRVPPSQQRVPVKKRVKSGAEKRKEKKLRELGIPPMEDLF